MSKPDRGRFLCHWIPFILVALPCFVANSASGEEAKDVSAYLNHVKRYADALIEQGTDKYGQEQSGMILSIMDRKKLKPFSSMPKTPHGVRLGDRVTPHGSNVNLDQNMYRVLYAMTEITGDEKYAQAADAALTKFLKTTPSPETNLLAWGEHLCWDLEDDAAACHGEKKIHETKRPTVLYEKFYELNPDVTIKYCHALWEHQIADHKDGNFSRHARYDKHGPGKNNDFPKEGGYMICDWSRAYEKTKDARFLDYIDVLASRYTKKMENSQRNLVAFDSIRGFADTSASISLAVECHDAAQRIGSGPVHDKLLALAAGIDRGLQALPHDVENAGFVQYVKTDDFSILDRKGNAGYSFMWSMKYGRKTTDMLGVLFYSRYKQLEDGKVKEKYKEMILQAADKYLTSDPDVKERPWPVELGMAMSLQLSAHELTGDQKYLDRAKHFANAAMAIYWPDDSPLPKADPECDHYENITRADTIAYSLLKIYVLEKSLPVKMDISNIDR